MATGDKGVVLLGGEVKWRWQHVREGEGKRKLAWDVDVTV